MNNEDILRLALEKTSTIAEAKEAAEWMKRFLADSPLNEAPLQGNFINSFSPAIKKESEAIKPNNNLVPPNNKKIWKEEEVHQVVKLHMEGVSNEDIGVLIGRKPNAVKDMLYKYETNRQIGHVKYIIEVGEKKNA